MAKIKSEVLKLDIVVEGDQGQRKIDNTTKSISELRKELKLAKTAMEKAVPGTQNFKNLQNEVKGTSARIKELTTGTKQVSSALKGLKAGTLAVVAAIAGVAKALKGFVSKIADFEQANANLSTVLGSSVAGISQLTENAKELGRTTEYTASQVSGLQMELAKLGFTQQQILAMTKPTLNFATAVGTDLSAASKLAGSTLRTFGLDASQTADTLSVLAVATNKSALDFSYLETSMSIVGPVAKAFGISLRDTTALLGTLANAGFDASSAATATRNILLNLADSSGKLATALGGPVKTFPELISGLQTLRNKGVDLATTLELTDKRSVSAFNAFLDGAENAAALRDSLEDVNGELDRIASERMNTVEGSIKSLQSAWEGFVLALSGSKGIIKDVITSLANGINRVTDAISGTPADTQGRGQKYMLSLFNLGYDEQAVRAAIDGEIAKAESEIRYAQKAVDNLGFMERGRNKVKKNLADKEDWLSVLQHARDSVTDYMNFSSSGGTPTPAPSSPPPPNNPLRPNKKYIDNKYYLLLLGLEERRKEGEFESEEEYQEELYNLEVSCLTARLSQLKDNSTERLKLEVELQQKIMKHKTDAQKQQEAIEKAAKELLYGLETDKTKIAENAEEKRYQEELKAFEKNKSAIVDQKTVLETIERNHQNNLLKIQLDAFDRQQDELKKKHDLDKLKIQNRDEFNLSSLKSGSGSEKAVKQALSVELAKSDLAYYSAQVSSLRELLDKTEDLGSATEVQLTELRTKLQNAILQLKSAQQIINGDNRGLAGGTGNGTLFGVSQNQWEAFIQRMKDGKLTAEDLVSSINAIGGVAETSFSIASQWIGVVNAKEKKELDDFTKANEQKKKDLKNQLDARLMSQAQYDQAVAEMEADEQARQEEMELEQAKRKKAMAITQATIQAAIAVAKTFAEWGYPLGIAPAAIMAAIGAAQVAAIAATPTGYATGGYVTREQDGRKFNAVLSPDKRGYVSRPTILVGEEGGEYVVPADGLQNASLAPILASIETARKAGTLKSLNFGAVYPVRASYGLASGGLVSNDTAPAATVLPSWPTAEIMSVLLEIRQKMNDPTPAVVNFLGHGGIKEAQDNYERVKSKGVLR